MHQSHSDERVGVLFADDDVPVALFRTQLVLEPGLEYSGKVWAFGVRVAA